MNYTVKTRKTKAGYTVSINGQKIETFTSRERADVACSVLNYALCISFLDTDIVEWYEKHGENIVHNTFCAVICADGNPI